MFSEIEIGDALLSGWPIIDVRSPGEFEKGHIPRAQSIPLFTNDERAHIGTVYKHQSQEEAIALGYTYVEPKLDWYITQSLGVAPDGKVVVHCWRGGMRSRSFAKHLSQNGFKEVKVITGGYKAYRNYVLKEMSMPFKLCVLGGYTGSGKTHILKALEQQGNQVVDLEGLANHKGSAFGGIGQRAQPTVEQFENMLHNALCRLNRNETVWVEDESSSIGKMKIPDPFFKQMRTAQLFFIDIPREERAKHLVTEYARCNSRLLAESIARISKRLGGLNVKNALEHLQNKNFYEVALIALTYYDKTYLKGMQSRQSENVITIPLPSVDHHKNAIKITQTLNVTDL